MLTFPLSDSAQFIVIEPGNIRRLKDGRPLKVELENGSSVLIAFTPDMAAFVAKLGISPSITDVTPGTRKQVRNIALSPEQIQGALDNTKHYPEVDR